MREQLRQLVAHITVAGLGAQHLHLRRKLGQKLAAGTAGGTPVFTVGVDGNAAEFAVTLADGLAAGSAFCEDRTAEGGVFHVAVGKDRAVRTLERRADGKA